MNKFVVYTLLLFSSASFAQYGNEWIDYSQKYYSFKIWQDGVYKLDYPLLVSAGVPVSTIDPDNFQIFGFEQEQYIWIEGGNDGSFDPGDYILFYGKKNDSWLDSLMYDNSDDVSNKYYPHYNDTINYFLTWNTSASNLRIQEETDVNYAAFTPVPYFLRTVHQFGTSTYLEGYKLSGMSYATYVEGEGWYGPLVYMANPINYDEANLSTTNVYTGVGAPNATGLSVSAGASNAYDSLAENHHLIFEYSTSDIELYDTIFSGYQKNNLSFSVSPNTLESPVTRFRHRVPDDLGLASDYQAVSFVDLTYPHTMNLENSSYYKMKIPFNATESKSRYDFTNFNSPNPWAFTLSGQMKKIPVIETAGTFQVLVPNESGFSEQEFVLFDESQIISISQLNAVNGSGNFTDFSTVDFELAYLIITHASLWSSATNYKAYRESIAGGSYNVVMADVQELYFQFGGGVEKHVMGVRRFCDYAWNLATNKPTHLFIIGKGVREANESISTGPGTKQHGGAYAMCMVPSFGYPSSDNLITARLEGNLWDPLLATGRLAALTNDEVNQYLAKVQEYEAAQDPASYYSVDEKLWQKEVLHFGGGANASEQNTFKYYLDIYEETLEDPEMGANVTGFYKTVSDPIDPVTLFEVTDIINEGVSIMTFFGHASADGFDQNVDDPANWNNQGKYPLVVGNACLTGNIHEPNTYSASENYVLLEDKGAIAFLANVKQAFSTSLHSYSNEFFTQVSETNYGGTIGEHIQNTIISIQSTSMSFGLKNVCLEMTLHGDPALRVNYHQAPELEVNYGSIFVTPNEVDLTTDSIDVNVIVYNIGKATTDTFVVELIRSFPNAGGDSIYTQPVYGLGYIDTIVFTIPLYVNEGLGLNTFSVTVDIPDFVDEHFDEIGNNQISKQVFFDVDGIYPVWPYDYAVVPDDTLVLKGSTVNPFAEMGQYRFEIDTTDLFNSPFKKFSAVTSLGGVVEVNYNQWLNANTGVPQQLILEDSMVYFWRVAVEDTGSYYWIESSFQHIDGKSGWGQDHFFQFKNGEFNFIEYDRAARRRFFGSAFKTIDADVYGNADTWLEFAFTLYHIDGEIAEYNFCGINPQIFVCVIDPCTLEPWGTPCGGENEDHHFGAANENCACRPRVEYHFGFPQDNPVYMDSLEYMILNEIPDSFYYLIYTSRYANYAAWDTVHPNIYNVFQGLGSDSIYPGRPHVPFILFGQMGDPAEFVEVYGQDIEDIIHFEDTLWGCDNKGSETSTLIGPAQEWSALYWKQFAMEDPSEDSTRLQVYGIDWAGLSTVLIDTMFTTNDSIITLNTFIDANDYPYLRLHAEYWDSTGLTPAQVDRWHVLFTGVPEAALDGTDGFVWLPGDSLQEGQQLIFAADIKNISDLPMDSLMVRYYIENDQHQLIPLSYPRQDSLRVGQTFRDTLFIDSENLVGYNSLWVEVNPYVSAGQTDQPEKYHFNNIGQLPFEVVADDENPILDVTFNGYHILNGDIVDPQSEIIISLKDENDFFIMNEESDTAFFGLYLTWPDGNQRRLNFRNALGEPMMEWIPADGSTKKFKIIYRADLSMDGTYRLLVQGADKSGNISGDFEYDIEFEIDHHSSITNLMNYPNPFSTQTHFVFTLTGSVIPEEFTIQIMTVTGKVVREITVDELGPIHIGRNITEYTWDGTDEYGDVLANGVYLYRVIVKIDGQTVDHRESGADKYFTENFGKMYILR
ncbi:MAG: hypothetical protein IPM74_02575 [Crocinitomicaceae bacterium]|nr:hypothetical protein [Crocinitomicaceae bacterium]